MHAVQLLHNQLASKPCLSVYAACQMLQVILQPAVATLHVTTLSLLCFDSTAAYMPVVHAGRMGRVVRTHGLQLHLLRYNTNTHAILSERRKPRMTYFPSALQLPRAGEEKQQSDSCQLFPCGDLEQSHFIKIYIVPLSFSGTCGSTMNGKKREHCVS